MIRHFLITLLVVFFTGMTFCGAYAEGPGTNAGQVLRLNLGGYAPAVGNAFTAYAAGAASMQYNPGGIAFTAKSESEMMYQDMIEGISQGNFALSVPLKQKPDFGHGFGVDMKFIDYGQFNRTVLGSGSGVSLNKTGGFSASDLATGIGYGMRFDQYSVGIIGRYISLQIDDAKATGMSTDLGVQWRHPEKFVRAGLVLKNLGTSVQFDKKEEDLPLSLRGGVSVTLFRQFRMNYDVEFVKGGQTFFNAGFEYSLLGYLPLRAGYNGRSDIDDGLTFGTGFKYERMHIDYAYIPFGDFGNNHLFGIRYRF